MITGEQVKAARKLLGWSQMTLALEARVEQSTVNSIASSRQARAAMEALAKEGLLATKSGDMSRRRRS
jgi:ribosome-binding protein aMBF1 (putative translation factor)